MYLPRRLYQPLARLDDSAWQAVIDCHPFWHNKGVFLDEEHQNVAFHILMNEGQIATTEHFKRSDSGFEFDAVKIDDCVLTDPQLVALISGWGAMHSGNFGSGLTVKMGWYAIRAGGCVGYHVDGPVFLKGARVDLSLPEIQLGLVELHASRRTILPLRFNPEDEFLICGHRAPLKRRELFEFSNVLPHAYFNRGNNDALLLVTTYLVDELIPEEITYSSVG